MSGPGDAPRSPVHPYENSAVSDTTDPATRPSGDPRAASTSHRAASPIIPPGIQPALLTAVLAALFAVTAPHGQWALLGPVVVLQAVTAAGWFRLNGMWPARQGILLAFAAGLAADVALLSTSREHGITAMVGTLGVWFLLVVLLQLRHRGGGDERLDALTATAASTLLTVVAAGHLAAVEFSSTAVVVAATAVAVAAVARGLVTAAFVAPVLAFALATAAGAGAAQLADLELWKGAALGAAAGACALAGLRVASYDFPSRFVHFTAGVALPLTAAAPAVYPLARVLL